MNLKTAAKISVLGAALVLSGCAWIPDTVHNHYQPPKNLSAVPGAENVTVHVTVHNDRPGKTKEDKDRLGYTENMYGWQYAGYYMNIKKDFTKAIEKALQKRGFKIGKNGVQVDVDVVKFQDQEHQGWNIYYTPSISILATIPKDGFQRKVDIKKLDFSPGVFGQFAGHLGRSDSANAAMSKAINKVVEDPAFIAALFRAAGQAQPAPGVSVPMIPAQG